MKKYNDNRDEWIEKLTRELVILRTKSELTQAELSSAIGLSRQTYCQIERRNIKMTWSVFCPYC